MKTHIQLKSTLIILISFFILLIPTQGGFARFNMTPTPFAVPDALKAKIEPQVIQSFSTTSNEKVSVIIELKEQANIEAIVDARDSMSLSDIKQRRDEVYQALKDTAEKSQVPLLSILNQGIKAHSVDGDIVSFFIINGIAASISQDMLLQLAEKPEVNHIYPDMVIQIPPQEVQASKNDVDLSGITWGVAKVRADKVWSELGIDGKGIVVGSIDSGVALEHPALKDKYRGKHTYQVYSFRDFVGGVLTPYDDLGHGTHVMGIIMGDGGSMHKIGIAPGAEWIAAKAIDGQGYGLSRGLLMAMEWIFAPDGVPRLAPDIVSNSWGGTCDSSDLFFRQAVIAWRSAGIIPVFSAGNRGPKAETIGAPGCFPEVIAVGATDINDKITEWSSRGPSFKDVLKPDISAPGNEIISSIPVSDYAKFSGTSMAAPAVSGVIALMLQANPDLSFDQVLEILGTSALDLGKEGDDFEYGRGRVDAYKAVLASKGGESGYQLFVPKESIAEKQPTYEWGIIADAEKFQLRVAKSSGEQILSAWYQVIDVCKGTKCSIQPTKPLEPGSYTWQIQASTAQGINPWSDTLAFTVEESMLSTPKPLAPQGESGENQPTFEWEAVDTATKYQLKVSDESGKETLKTWYNANDICSGKQCAVKIAITLTPAPYSWQVQAADEQSSSQWSDALHFTISQDLSGTVELISPTGDISEISPTYQWKAVASATRYQLNVKDEANKDVIASWYDAAVICTAENCMVKTTDALSVGSYTWRVQSATTTIEGAWSKSLSFKLTQLPLVVPEPLTPQGDISENQPAFVWQGIDKANEYKLKVSKASGEKVLTTWYTATDICSADKCSVNPNLSLTEGSYLWQVQAASGNQSSPWSKEIPFTVKPAAPTAPVLQSPSGGINDVQPTFQWNPSKGASEYRLVVTGSVGDVLRTWYKTQDVCDASKCSVKPTLTLESGSYSWQVQASSPAGAIWSDAMQFNLLLSAPPAPSGISPSEQIIEEQPTFRWSAVQGIDEYQLKVVNEQGGVSFSKWYRHKDFCSSTICTAKLSTRLEKGKYYWQVQSSNVHSSSAWSDALRFTLHELPPQVGYLIAPSGNISEAQPVFKWNAVNKGLEYEIRVNDATHNNILSGCSHSAFECERYRAADICSETLCSTRHTTEIAPGSYTWQIRASGDAGTGVWSRALAFIVSEPPLAAVTPLSPSGKISDAQPKFEWYYVQGATHYQLKVVGPAGEMESVFQMKYSAQGICSGTRCLVSQPMKIAEGEYTWQVMTSNGNKLGAWSRLMKFTVQANQTTPTANPAPPTNPVEESYIVQPGDSLTSLARRWGVSLDTLSALNNISYPYILRIGQVLKKPK